MRVPDVTRHKHTTESHPSSKHSVHDAEDVGDGPEHHETPKHRGHGRSHAPLKYPDSKPRTVPAEKKLSHDAEQKKQAACPDGKNYYACANGFSGCCSIDPCDPGASCPDHHFSSATTKETTTSKSVAKPTTHVTSSAEEQSSHHKPTETSHTTKSTISTAISTASSSKGTSSTSSADSATPTSNLAAPSCPDGNGTTFEDTFAIKYFIHCNSDNSYSSDKTIMVSVGGYSECFSACSKSKSCAGFTYVGTGSGVCYHKAQMPSDKYVQKAGSNYISCAKLDPQAVALSPASENVSAVSNKPSVGVIVGGVLGGVAFFGLLLVLIAFLARRKRRKVEEKRAITTHVISAPLETQRFPNPVSHQRQASSSHDVFVPFQGFLRRFGSKRTDSKAEGGTTLASDEKTLSSLIHPGVRAEGGFIVSHTQSHQTDSKPTELAIINSVPIHRGSSRTSCPRSPRFHELVWEPENRDSTPLIESPTLGINFESMMNAHDYDEGRMEAKITSNTSRTAHESSETAESIRISEFIAPPTAFK